MKYNRQNTQLAKQMRSNMTDAESKLWYYLRAKRLNDIKFKRQVPIGSYIVDFLAPDKKLIIELDGGQHNEEINIEYDTKRTEYLESKGYKVIRIWNNDVLDKMDDVLDFIKENL